MHFYAGKNMYNDREKLEKIFHDMVKIIGSFGAWNLSPVDGVHEQVIGGVIEAIKKKSFCATVVSWLGIGSPFHVLLMEYLCAETSQGYNMSGVDPRCFVDLRNTGVETIPYTASVKEVKVPQTDRRWTTLSKVNYRTYKEIEPGETARLPVRTAMTMLKKYCPYAHHEHAERLKMPRVQTTQYQVTEVGGGILTYDSGDEFGLGNNYLTWGRVSTGDRRDDTVRSKG